MPVEFAADAPVVTLEQGPAASPAQVGLRAGIAAQLASYQGQLGDWREIFRSVEKIDAVTKDDIMRVAQATFVPTNRTVGMIVTEETESANDE